MEQGKSFCAQSLIVVILDRVATRSADNIECQEHARAQRQKFPVLRKTWRSGSHRLIYGLRLGRVRIRNSGKIGLTQVGLGGQKPRS